MFQTVIPIPNVVSNNNANSRLINRRSSSLLDASMTDSTDGRLNSCHCYPCRPTVLSLEPFNYNTNLQTEINIDNTAILLL